MADFPVLADIIEKRGSKGHNTGGNSLRWIELFGGELVPTSAHEPDPSTFRGEFYYNTRQNRLFKKIRTLDDRVVWKRASRA